jgi:mono/diheme cytochrome c family protein
MDPKGRRSELQERPRRKLRPPAARTIRRAAAASIALRLAFGAVAAGHVPTFGTDAAPLFARWCVACHGPRQAHGGLRLDSYVGVLRGGDAGPAITPRAPDDSLLIAKIERRHAPAMPPKRRLPPQDVARLRAWIAAGAPR